MMKTSDPQCNSMTGWHVMENCSCGEPSCIVRVCLLCHYAIE